MKKPISAILGVILSCIPIGTVPAYAAPLDYPNTTTIEQPNTTVTEDQKPTDTAPVAQDKQAVPDVQIKDSLEHDEAYISSLTIDQMDTGMAPFDQNDDRGNDSSPDNDIIRSFDKVMYSVQFVATPDDPMTYYKNAYVGFNVTIPHDRQKAVFDTGSLSWAEQDDKHKPTVKTNPDGSQTLTCYRRLVSTSTSPYTIPGTYTVPFAIDVRAMVEGETLQPEFKAWVVPNDVKNRVAKVTPRPVKVTSYPRFDVSLAQGYNGYAASGGTDAWDFPASGGSGSYPSDEMHTDMGRSNGILTQVAMSVSMRNRDKGKYMKGLEIPRKGTPLKVSFTVSNNFTKTDETKPWPQEKELQPYFYAVQSERKNGDFQNKNRTYWDRWQYRDDYAAYPNNYEYDDNRNTYRSGKAEVKETRRLNGTDYEVTIHDWDVDIDKFPTRNFGSTNPCAVFSDNNCKLNEGVISMLVFRTFTPSELNGTSLPEHYNASIMLRQRAQVTGMHITGQTGVEVTEQTNTNNDVGNLGQMFEPDGSFNMRTYYACMTVSKYVWANGNDCKGWKSQDWSHGTDSVIRGNKVKVQLLSDFSTSNMRSMQTMLPINLVKIDDKVMELGPDLGITKGTNGQYRLRDGSMENVSTPIDIYYAVKKDGKGWVDDDEQKKATIDDLDYYKTYDEAIGHGVPVGLLFASRTASKSNKNNQWFTPAFTMMVKKDAPIGYVAQITQQAQMWTRKDLARRGINIDVNDSDAWDEWARTIDPLEFRKTMTPTYNDQSWDGRNRNYIKASYDRNNNYVPGVEGQRYGDSMTILGEKARVSVITDQKTPNGTVEQGGKTIYDLDKEQRVVDWRVSGNSNVVGLTAGTGSKTDWTISVVIPKGLRYIDGSSYFEGIYKENTPLQGTVEGGRELTPYSVTPNGNGSTTILYKLQDMPNGMEFRPIHFSTVMGDASNPGEDTKNGDQFTVTATIATTNDMSRPDFNSQKMASFTVLASRTKASSLGTRAESLITDIEAPLRFVNMITNASNQSARNVLSVGIIPNNGYNGSRYHGEWRFTGLEFMPEGVSLDGNIELYVTTDPKYSGINPLELGMDEITTRFVKVDAPIGPVITADHMGLPDAGRLTAYALLVRDLPAGARLDTKVNGNTTGNKASDMYVNMYSDGNNVVSTVSTVVSRSINGRVWEDKNRNGSRDDGEPMVRGVKVRLVRRDAGKEISTQSTGADGRYEFTELPAGDYTVLFTAPDGKDWGLWKVTTVKADGVDESRNNDATSISTEDLSEGAHISDVKRFPNVEEMTTSRFVVNNKDLGIVYKNGPVFALPATGSPWLLVVLAVGVMFCVACWAVSRRPRSRRA